MAAPKTGKNTTIVVSGPEVLKAIGDESKRNATDRLTSRQINKIIKDTRAQKSKG